MNILLTAGLIVLLIINIVILIRLKKFEQKTCKHKMEFIKEEIIMKPNLIYFPPIGREKIYQCSKCGKKKKVRIDKWL